MMTNTEPIENVRILVVDDDQRNLESMISVLASSDYQVMTASSGQEALGHLLKYPFALLILDVMMPEMNGFELARLIKARKKHADIPIIFLTAFHTDEKDVFQGYLLGAFDYLSKPTNPAVLKAKVAVFVDLYRRIEAEKRQYRHLVHLADSSVPSVLAMDPKWETDYRNLLLAHIRALRLRQPSPSDQLGELAQAFAVARMRTRDVVGLHVRVVKSLTEKLMSSDAEGIGLDARLCLLEFIGCLLDLYEEANMSITRSVQKGENSRE